MSGNDRQRLISTLNDMTAQLQALKDNNTRFRNEVKQRIEALNTPIVNSISYIQYLKQKIAELQREIDNDLNENTQEAIEKAKVKLAEFQTEIANTNELDRSLQQLTESVNNLKEVAKDDPPTIAGGSNKKKEENLGEHVKKEMLESIVTK